jgi:glycosyltransferase involved in cell wall biosynthesis
MRIAFDATVLQEPKSGIGYYCEELLRSLARTDHEAEYFVFSHRRLPHMDIGSNGNLRWCSERPFPIRAVYLHALLPGILNRIRPDLCHYTNFLAPIIGGKPYVVTIHDMSLESLASCHPAAKRLYTKRLAPSVAHNARLVLTNSEYSRWEIVRWLGISEDRIRVTPLAASPEFRPLPEAQHVSEPYFLYVGNLEPRKNLDRLLDAFATLKHLDHKLWIAGGALYRAGAVIDKAKALGLEDRVRFLGYVPRQDLPNLYRGAAVFVYPSLLEGFGLPVIEAMACGTPVITSNNSALREVAGDAALLVDPLDVQEIARAMGRFALEPSERAEFGKRGVQRAAEFSWEATAQLTLNAYQEAVSGPPRLRSVRYSDDDIAHAIGKTLHYATLFEYPLQPHEIHARLYEVAVDRVAFDRVLERLKLPFIGGFVCDDAAKIQKRALREQISDRAIEQTWPLLETLAAFPFVRMLAFSGATAHRNMTDEEDVDLFVIVEKGKLWFTFTAAIVWARLRGVRKNLCMNYLITDSTLPLTQTDAFTAQQLASIKPLYGKSVYDRLLELNPFVRRRFPQFDARRNRESYSEIPTGRIKSILEIVLRCGAVQLLEPFSRLVLGRHLRRKAQQASVMGDCDVLIEPQRLKLHLHSHKKRVLEKAALFKP